MKPTRATERLLVGLCLTAPIAFWGFATVRSAAGLVIPRDLVEYLVGALALVAFLIAGKRLPARGSVLMIGLYVFYVVAQFLARDDFRKVQVLSLIEIVFPVSFFVVGFVLWNYRRFATPFKVFAGMMAFSAVVGLANYYFGFAEPLFLLNKLDRAEVGSEVVQRGGSLASQSLGTGLYSVLGIFIATGLPRRYKALIPIFLLSLLSTLSRGGIVALLAGSPMLIWFSLPPPGPKREKVFQVAKIAASVALALVVVSGLSSSGKSSGGLSVVFDRFVGDLFNTKEEGNTSRILSWQNDLDVWSKSPVVGNGLGILGTIAVTETRLNGHEALAAESTYLQILGEQGVIGLGLYLLMLFSLFSDCWQALTWGDAVAQRPLAVSALSGFVALALGGLFLQNLSDVTGSFFWYFAGGLVAYRLERLPKRASRVVPPRTESLEPGR